jgi:hypothetical protein
MRLRTAAVFAALTGLVAGPLVSVMSVGAGPVAVSRVAMFSSEEYTDVEEEDANLIDDIEAGGHTVVIIDDISAAAFTAGLDGANVLILPEQSAEVVDDLSAEAAAVITDWVAAGGRLVLTWVDDASYVLNELFGFSTETNGACNDSDEIECPLTAAAGDTEFADGPDSLVGIDATDSIISSSLPPGSTVIYEGLGEPGGEPRAAGELSEPGATVAAVPVEDGVVITFGWDWYPENEGGVEAAATPADEADWATVLDLALSQPEVSASSPAAGALELTMDSPSTQPVFVRLVIDGTEHIVVIAAKTTSAAFDVGGQATVEWDVPGWGIGEGTVEVAGATAAPPAEPAPAAPTFTG